MRTPRALTLIGLLTFLAAWPAASPAATVSAEEFCDVGDVPCDEPVSYAAAPGEVNNPVFTVVSSSTMRVDDPSANLTAGTGCSANGAHQITCTLPRPVTQVSATLGDGNDTFSEPGSVFAFVNGGPGDDTLNGSSVADSLDGGGGTDTLHGNGGGDQLFDGDTTGAASSDVIDGGPGSDLVVYFLRTAPVTVDLNSPSTAGEAGENDKLTSIESAQGGNAADVLTGDDGPNELVGFGGADVIDGRGGNDTIDGGKTQIGGAGDDTLTSLETGGTVSCGAGADLVGLDAPTRKVPTDCETIVLETGSSQRYDLLTSRGPLKAKGNVLFFRFRCTKVSDSKCTGKVSIQVGGKTVARATLPATKAGRRRELAIALPAAVAKKVRGAGVTATVTFKPPGGRSAGYTTLLKV